MSNVFSVSNGVKQGGVRSLYLFTVYMGGLLNRLQKTGIDCHMVHRYIGAFAYADNITLMSPSCSVLAVSISEF